MRGRLGKKKNREVSADTIVRRIPDVDFSVKSNKNLFVTNSDKFNDVGVRGEWREARFDAGNAINVNNYGHTFSSGLENRAG